MGQGPVRADEIIDALRVSYCPPTWVFLAEVNTATGYCQGRRIDALAISPWPSRGLEMQAFEVKVSKSDFIKEKNLPRKADSIFKYVDRFWIATPKDLILDSEMPISWGLIEVSPSGRIHRKVDAPILKPVPPNKMLLASILRNFSESYISKRFVDDRIRSGVEREIESRTISLRGQVEKLTNKIKEFEDASGISLEHSWDMERIGEIVKMLLSHHLGYIAEEAVRVAQNAVKGAAIFSVAAEEMQKLVGVKSDGD